MKSRFLEPEQLNRRFLHKRQEKAKANLVITFVMTVAGQKNHYNVKFLEGYGVSINLKDNRICLKGGRGPFTGEQESEACL